MRLQEITPMLDGQGTITTGVDSLIALLEQKKKISIEEAAKQLHIKDVIVQNWVDFLVEEDIIGVEYKLITPYIFLKETSQKQSFDSKEEFYDKARMRGIEEVRIDALWSKYLDEHIESIKEAFYAKANARGMQPDKIEQMWIQYEEHLHEGEEQ
ncbi:MAG: putative ArsR family transcriptional regulator [Candidatus Woesearchaeota archaeon]|jgi:predicted ArsR family transcriptional regulator